MGAESAYGLWILVAINSASIGLALRNSEPVANAAGHSYGIEGGKTSVQTPRALQSPRRIAPTSHYPLNQTPEPVPASQRWPPRQVLNLGFVAVRAAHPLTQSAPGSAGLSSLLVG